MVGDWGLGLGRQLKQPVLGGLGLGRQLKQPVLGGLGLGRQLKLRHAQVRKAADPWGSTSEVAI